jgi:hypothetical protein
MLLAPLLYCAGGRWALGRAERAEPPARLVAHEHWWLLGLVSACIIGTPLLNTRASFPEGAKLSTREAWMEARFGAAYTAARARPRAARARPHPRRGRASALGHAR